MKNKQNIKSFFVHVLFATICFNLNVVQAQVHNVLNYMVTIAFFILIPEVLILVRAQ
jgi:uncharacterized Tic20 family protein